MFGSLKKKALSPSNKRDSSPSWRLLSPEHPPLNKRSMQATTSHLTLRLITLPKSLGRRERKRELNAETVDLNRVEREEKGESLVKISLTAETESKVKKEEAKEDAEETPDSDI